MRLLRRLIILSHRYLGIAISLMCVVWFASGIVMIYAGGMPRISQQTRLERRAPVDFSRITISPAAASQRLGFTEAVGPASLLSVMDRPAYRFPGPQPETVFADTGEVLSGIDIDTARSVASRFAGVPVDRVHFEHTLEEPDQWTLLNARSMPTHKFRLDDDAGTELYVSPRTAEVIVATTGRERALAWIGTIPHWLYFTSLRTNQPLWYKVVVWLSTLACVLAVLGLVLAFTQAPSFYRSWMRWHYIVGAVFGVFVLTWAFSGLLSMEPYAWTNARGLDLNEDALTGGPTELEAFGGVGAAGLAKAAGNRDIKEVELVRIHGEHYYSLLATDSAPADEVKRERLHQPYLVAKLGEPTHLLINASTLEVRQESFSADSIVARLKAALPNAPLAEQALLTEYDDYYYSRGRQSPLPVLRVKFADPMQTWYYIDPRTSEPLAQVHRYSRIERWLYNGLHSLDFEFWYSKRPLWDIGMIVLCLGGLATSALGCYLGIKRLVRDFSRVRA